MWTFHIEIWSVIAVAMHCRQVSCLCDTRCQSGWHVTLAAPANWQCARQRLSKRKMRSDRILFRVWNHKRTLWDSMIERTFTGAKYSFFAISCWPFFPAAQWSVSRSPDTTAAPVSRGRYNTIAAPVSSCNKILLNAPTTWLWTGNKPPTLAYVSL